MLGYAKAEITEVISLLCGIEASPEDVAAINKAIDLLDGLIVEGYFD